MTFDLPIPHRGDRLSAARAAQLHREVRQNRILPSPGVKVIRGPNGTYIIVDIPKPRARAKVTPPGNFEPVFAEEEDSQSDPPRIVLDHVGVGFYPFGCRFFRVDALTIDESAKIAHGMIWLEIVVASSSDNHTATVKGQDYDEETESEGSGSGEGEGEGSGEGESEGDEDSDPFVNDGTNGKFQIPLYEIKNGAIKTDFRSCMSLPIRIY